MSIKSIGEATLSAVSSFVQSSIRTVKWSAHTVATGFNKHVVGNVSSAASSVFNAVKKAPQSVRTLSNNRVGVVILALAVVAGVAILAVRYFRRDPVKAAEKAATLADTALIAANTKARDAEKAEVDAEDIASHDENVALTAEKADKDAEGTEEEIATLAKNATEAKAKAVISRTDANALKAKAITARTEAGKAQKSKDAADDKVTAEKKIVADAAKIAADKKAAAEKVAAEKKA